MREKLARKPMRVSGLRDDAQPLATRALVRSTTASWGRSCSGLPRRMFGVGTRIAGPFVAATATLAVQSGRR